MTTITITKQDDINNVLKNELRTDRNVQILIRNETYLVSKKRSLFESYSLTHNPKHNEDVAEKRYYTELEDLRLDLEAIFDNTITIRYQLKTGHEDEYFYNVPVKGYSVRRGCLYMDCDTHKIMLHLEDIASIRVFGDF